MYMKRNKKEVVIKEKKNFNFKFLWAINLVVFAFVVFLGIEQAGKGAEISSLENKIEESVIYKRDLSEKIFNNEKGDIAEDVVNSLGYVKPTEVYYFKTDEVYASILR